MLTHKDFFYFSIVSANNYVQCHPIEITEDFDNYFKGGDYLKKMPKTFIQTRGRKRNDIIGGTLGLYLISEKIKCQLENSKVTGVEFVPIEIKSKSGNKYDGYYAMIITGRGKAANKNDASLKLIKTSSGTTYKNVGYLFPIESWDGSDIFYLEGSKAVIILTEKAKRIFEQYSDICVLKRCDEYIWPV